eukprot:COSAG01_NODE_1013_length_12138_cov_7.073926_13_plen_79_part_00
MQVTLRQELEELRNKVRHGRRICLNTYILHDINDCTRPIRWWYACVSQLAEKDELCIRLQAQLRQHGLAAAEQQPASS